MNGIPVLTVARWAVGLAASYTFGRALGSLIGPQKNLLAKAAIFVGSMTLGCVVERAAEIEFDKHVTAVKKELAKARTS